MKRNLSRGWADYPEHFSSSEDVVKYDELFASDACERSCWEVQRPILLSSLTELLACSSATGRGALDFACGTGRITEVVRDAGWAVVGLDGSPAMLDLARRRLPNVEFRVGRLGEPATDEWASFDGGFQLITTFRFFLNAPSEERATILGLLAELLSPGGYLVLNNHGSSPSLRSISLWVRRKHESTVLTQREFRMLLDTADLKIEQQWGGHILTRSLYRVSIVGTAVRAIERHLPSSSLGRWMLRRVGANQTYVCSRS